MNEPLKEKCRTLLSWSAQGIVGAAAWVGVQELYKFTKVGIPIALTLIATPQAPPHSKPVENPGNGHVFIVGNDQIYIQAPPQRFVMPMSNTFITTSTTATANTVVVQGI